MQSLGGDESVAVARLGRHIEEAGVAIYTLIRDHLIIPGAAALLALSVYASFVRSLDLSDANFLFPSRDPFPSRLPRSDASMVQRLNKPPIPKPGVRHQLW